MANEFKRGMLAATALGSVALIATPAFGQTARSSGLEDIVVTAQKREQSIQDVPTSVTALTAEDLEVNRITNVGDLDSVSPALSITSIPAGNSGPVYSMRGVVAIGTAPGADKGVALYIDGVYIGSASGSTFDLAEIERIEVLKGPQGTLFGRNSTGGAINITTRGPRGEFRLQQKISAGNYAQFDAVTRLDTPQFGPISAAFTYAHSERRGDIRNLGAGTVWDGTALGTGIFAAAPYLGSENSESFAASVRLEATPDFEVEYKFDYSKRKFSEGGVGQVSDTNPVATINLLNSLSGFPLVADVTRPKAVNNNATVPSSVEAEGHVLTATWQASDTISIKNIAAYRRGRYYAPLNNLFGTGGLFYDPAIATAVVGSPFLGPVGGPVLFVATTSEGTDKQYSDELQIDYDSTFMHLTVGGIYYEQDNLKGQAGTGPNTIEFAIAPNFVLPGIILSGQSASEKSSVKVTSYGFYAHGEFHVTDQIDLVAGARWTKDKKRGVDRTVLALGIGDLNFDDKTWTYNLGVNYKPNDDVMLYAKYQTGYISGGKLATLDYFPEKAKSFEAGIKADWLDRRLRTNISAFHVKYESLQVANQGRTWGIPQASQVLANAGDAKAKGFEAEITAVPIPSITLNAAVSYLDFKYTKLDPRFVASGQGLVAQRPKWQGQFSAQYESPPISGEAYVSARLDANFREKHTGSSFFVFEQESTIPTTWIVNGRIGIEEIDMKGGELSVAAWVKNLFDEDAPRYILYTESSASTNYVPARTYGVDVTVTF